MDPITPSNRSREAKPAGRQVSPEVYWRRRLFTLAGGLAVLGLLAWAVGGASTAHPTASTASYNQAQQSAPPVNPTPTISSPSPSPSATKPSPKPTASKAHTTAKRHTTGRKLGSGLNAPGDDCSSADTVISLTANGDDFGTTLRPEFTVTVVSTSGQTCAFNVGGRYLTVDVESGGVHEWGSADCYRGAGVKVDMLSRGVPVTEKITWNRELSSPGCHLAATPARAGAYTATASDAGVSSHTIVFTLG
jgi:hypothetical protein